MLKKVIVVVGPTASGKSDLAVLIAFHIIKNKKQFGVSGAAVISADSRQVYKGFDITSGKVTKKEMGGIDHFMLGVASPFRTYSASRYKKEASKIIATLHKKNIIPIVCGGTGFYINSLLYDYSLPNVAPSASLRARLNTKTTAQLFNLLKQKDSLRATSIDRYNRRRLIRALEIILTTGKKVPPLLHKNMYDALVLGIHISFDNLEEKIKSRLLARIRRGMITEVTNLHKQGLSWKRLEGFGLEYRWVSLFLQKKILRDEMIAALIKDIRHYAKRQMTWFSKNKDIVWVDKTKLSRQFVGIVNEFLKNI